ncbi:MAG TPA: hypothetical protein VD999_05735 [Vitreimonas sp.]|nr:hypothetical protein [Vitreimonas sp.]
MSRTALLPSSGDPFLLTFWFGQFLKVWQNEVDELIIHLNGYAEAEVVEYVRQMVLLSPKAKFIHTPSTVTHGNSIDLMLDEVKTDLVVLLEEDAPIFKPGTIDYCFKYIEEQGYEVVGSKRGSCALEILERAKEVWGLDYSGYGDQGCNFWPCFLFTKTQILKDTDRNFDSKQWKAGTYIPELDWTTSTDVHGDTFVNTSLQLRAKKCRIKEIPQYHCYTDDMPDYEKKMGIYDGYAPWVHIGSLSSCFNGALVDDTNRALGRRLVEAPKSDYPLQANTVGEKQEWERRLVWLSIAYSGFHSNDYLSKETKDILKVFSIEYGNALEKAVRYLGLNKERMFQRMKIYLELLNKYV